MNYIKLTSYLPKIFYCLWSLGKVDMAIHKFTNLILKNKPIEVYNFGNHGEDFLHR